MMSQESLFDGERPNAETLTPSKPLRARKTDPDTSHQAAEAATKKLPKRCLLALAYFYGATLPVSDFALAKQFNGLQTSWGNVRLQLQRQGSVRAVPERGTSPSNSGCIQYEITAQGRAHWESEGRQALEEWGKS